MADAALRLQVLLEQLLGTPLPIPRWARATIDHGPLRAVCGVKINHIFGRFAAANPIPSDCGNAANL